MIDNRELMIEGYKLFRKNSNVHWCGVAIYMKDAFDGIQVEQQMDKLELLSLEIKPETANSFSCLMVLATNLECGRCYLRKS